MFALICLFLKYTEVSSINLLIFCKISRNGDYVVEYLSCCILINVDFTDDSVRPNIW